MLRLSIALCSLVVCAAALAEPAQWNVDRAKSSLQFVVDVNGQTVTGRFRSFDAIIAFDPADLAHSSAKITIDMGNQESGDATRDAMLGKPDWFNVPAFPKAVFQTTAFASKGGNAYEARGRLTMKGLSRELVLPLTIAIAGDIAVAKGEVTILRTDFKVGQGKQFETDKPVARAVKVLVNVTAKRTNSF